MNGPNKNEETVRAQSVSLGRFLVDRDFERLVARLQTFNAFRALRMEDYEVRHSNVLGWLMDPAQTHGMGAIFLRRFLSSILLQESDTNVELSAGKVEMLDIRDVEVRREWKHIDLLVIDRGNKLVLLIENKVWGSESKGQLARYRAAVAQEFPGFQQVLVLLTRQGEGAAEPDSGCVCWSYARVLEVLERIVDQRRQQMTEPVASFVCQYIDVLRRLTMSDDELNQLCKSIYRKHHEAVDLIVSLGRGNVFHQVGEELLRSRGFEILSDSSSWLWFLPKELIGVVPENGVAWSHLSRNVCVSCWALPDYGDKIRLVFECCATTDAEQRLHFVTELRDHGFKLTKKAFQPDATFSRFYSNTEHVDDMSDEDEVKRALSVCLDQSKAKFETMAKVCRKVFGGKQGESKPVS